MWTGLRLGKKENGMLLGISGFGGSGKDTTADYLASRYGFVRVSFAEKLREFCYEINPKVMTPTGTRRLRQYVDEVGYVRAKWDSLEFRELMQAVGHGARVIFGDEFWIKQALTEDVLRNENVVITDVRYQNEAETISNLGGYIIRVQRDKVGPVNNHITEKPLPFDYALNNPEKFMQGLYSNIDVLLHNLSQLSS